VDKARALASQTGDSLLMALAKVGDGAGPALKAKVQAFVECIGDLALMSRDQPASRVVQETLRRTGYMAMLEADASPEGINRVENVSELAGAVAEFALDSGSASLAEYLDRVALVQPLDGADAETADALNLMTIHSAKGLEFDVVFVAGLEEELFPHGNSLDTAAGIEEERRLMYVAMTRARDQLFLTCASTRSGYRGVRTCRRSRFLSELPRGVKVV
jgi:DNA helicase-2/ATP-dependent DNA helicase PcrA